MTRNLKEPKWGEEKKKIKNLNTLDGGRFLSSHFDGIKGINCLMTGRRIIKKERKTDVLSLKKG